ncbi:MAG: hypothetical protein NWR72_02445, partial [Bacteroidia bacterium]|nr:hypothetical protein [Bacteroidia bacterium]
ILGRSQDRIEGFGRELCLDQDGDLWIGTSGYGIYRVALPEEKVSQRKVAEEPGGLGHNMITDLQPDAHGNLWIATDGGGLNSYHATTGKWQQFNFSVNHPGTLNTDALYDIMFDRKGNLWVGTFNGGLNLHSVAPSAFASNREYTQERILGLRSVLTMSEETDGQLWMGTDGAGLFRMKTSGPNFQIVPFSLSDSLFSAKVITSIATTREGNLWLGTYGEGLFYLDTEDGSWRQFTHDQQRQGSISHNNFWDLVIDSSGGLWVGTLGGGLNYLAPGQSRFTSFQEMIPAGGLPLSGVQIIDMLLDKSGQYLWIATENQGLNRLDTRTLSVAWYKTQLDNPESLSSDRLRCLFEDRAGNIWVGTEFAGINRIESGSGKIFRYAQQDGLPSEMINSIVQDKNGHLWISTQAGITRWDRETNTFLNLGSDPFLENNQFNPNAALALEDGRLIFGRTNGYAVVLPEKVMEESMPPKVILADLYLSNQLISIGDGEEYGILNGSLNDSNTVVQLSYKDRGIQFLLAVDHSAQASQWGYQYRLQNYETQWHELRPGVRAVTYSGLPGGFYTLEMRTLGSQGEKGPVK